MTSKKETKQIIAKWQDLLDSLSPDDQKKVRQVMEKSLADPLEAVQTSEISTDYKAKAEAYRVKVKAQAPVKRMERFQQLHLVENKTVIPNLAAKTGLFAPVQKGRRKFFRDFVSVPVWGLPDVEVSYKHEQLNQLDLNVYLLLVSFARRRGENYAAFTKREALRLNDSGKNYREFDKFIDRLGSTRVRIIVTGQNRRYVLRDALAPRDYHESWEGLYVVELSTALEGFFAVDDWSLISLPQRLELGQNQWALTVHAFLSANKAPVWFSWEQIHNLWGQGYGNLSMLRRDFRRRVLKPPYEIGFLKRVRPNKGTKSSTDSRAISDAHGFQLGDGAGNRFGDDAMGHHRKARRFDLSDLGFRILLDGGDACVSESSRHGDILYRAGIFPDIAPEIDSIESP